MNKKQQQAMLDTAFEECGIGVNPDLHGRGFLPIPYTSLPKRRMKPFDVSDVDIDTAAARGEFIARVLESEELTPNMRNTARILIIAACLYTAKALDTHHPDPQMARDFYPWLSLVDRKRNGLDSIFQLFVDDLAHEMPKFYETYFPNKKGGEE